MAQIKTFFIILFQIFGQLFAYDLIIEKYINDLDFNALYKHIKIKNNPINKKYLEKYLEILKEKGNAELAKFKTSNKIYTKLQLLKASSQFIKIAEGVMFLSIGYGSILIAITSRSMASLNFLSAWFTSTVFTHKGNECLQSGKNSKFIINLINRIDPIEMLLNESVKQDE